MRNAVVFVIMSAACYLIITLHIRLDRLTKRINSLERRVRISHVNMD